MKALLIVTLILVVALTGCSLFQGGPDSATRIAAGLACLGALAGQGITVASDPSLGFSTALDVFNAITKITNAAVAAAVEPACASTLALLMDDVTGAKQMHDATVVTTPTVQGKMAAKKRLSPVAKPQLQAGPTKVIIPL